MTTRKTIPLTLGLIFGLYALAIAQEAQKPGPVDKDDARLKEKVADLGSKLFEVRERAMEALREAGDKAIPLLEEAVQSDDAEVTWRAKALLRDIRNPKDTDPREDDRGRPRWSEEFRPAPGLRHFRRWFGFGPDRDLERLFGRDPDIDRLQERVQKEIAEFQRRFFGDRDEDGRFRGLNWSVRGGQQGIRIQRGPNGETRMEVLRDGKWVPFGDRTGLEDSTYGLALEPASDALRAQLSLPEGEGLVVTDLRDDGPGSRAGLQKYDVIASVNGEAVRTAPAVAEAIASTPEGQDAVLGVVRRAEPLEVKLPVQRTRKPRKF